MTVSPGRGCPACRTEPRPVAAGWLPAVAILARMIVRPDPAPLTWRRVPLSLVLLALMLVWLASPVLPSAHMIPVAHPDGAARRVGTR